MSQLIYNKTKEVYNKLGRKYLNDSRRLIPLERANFAKLFAKKSTILDVGCGGGRDAKFFVQKGLQVVGTDFSNVMIKIAKEEVPKAKFICEDILKSKLKADTFDGIWANAMLLHLKRKDVPKAIKKFYNLLKPGGILHVRVKKGKGEEFVKEKLSGWQERFYTYFSIKEMEEMIKKQGFRVTKCKEIKDEQKRPGVSWVLVWAKK